MTSGIFSSFPVEQIWVDRDKRQRRVLTGIQELADSISRAGLINPPVIERTGELRAGERRWTAVKLLGWTHMSVQFVDEIDESMLQLIELEENIRRVNIEWPDECRAVQRYDALMRSEQAEWSDAKTGLALGMTGAAIGQRLAIAKELDAGTQLVVNAPKFSTALGITTRLNERKRQAEVEQLEDLLSPPGVVRDKKIPPLLNVDFIEWSKSYSGPKFNFLHCDFPYGVNANNHAQGQAKSLGGYADSPQVYWDLLSHFASIMPTLVAESAHLMFWFSMDYYTETKQALEKMGWSVNPFPLLWFKSDNTGILPDPSRGPRRVYETAFLASRGDRKIIQAVANTIAWPGKDKEIHMSEKPRGMLAHFFRMICDEYTVFLDPTAGSGNACFEAERAGAKTVVGLERDPEFFRRAVNAYYRPVDFDI